MAFNFTLGLLQIVTLNYTPFVLTRPSPDGTCDEQNKERLCPLTNETTGNTTNYCCYGYCIEMLIDIAENVNFTFSLHLSPSMAFGSYQKVRFSFQFHRYHLQWNYSLYLMLYCCIYTLCQRSCGWVDQFHYTFSSIHLSVWKSRFCTINPFPSDTQWWYFTCLDHDLRMTYIEFGVQRSRSNLDFQFCSVSTW